MDPKTYYVYAQNIDFRYHHNRYPERCDRNLKGDVLTLTLGKEEK